MLVLRPVLLVLHVAVIALLLEVGAIVLAGQASSWPGVHAGRHLHSEWCIKVATAGVNLPKQAICDCSRADANGKGEGLACIG